MEEQSETFALGKYLPMGSEGKKHTGMYVGDTWVPASEMNQDVRDAYRGVVETLYPTADGNFTRDFWKSDVSVNIDKLTGDITVKAPSRLAQEDWFKQNYLENENLKKLSQAYKLNPSYSFETTDENGNTVYKTAEELVNEYDAGLKKAAETLNTLYTERDRILRPIYGEKVDKMSTEDIRTALTPTYDVGDIKVSGSTVISLPDFLLNHSIFGAQIKQLSSYNAENGTVTREDFMENFWNRNKNPELTAERIQELYQNLGTSLKYSSWDDVVEDDYERHGANQAAREIAFRNFIYGQDPEADFWLKTGDTVTGIIGGIGLGLSNWSIGVINAAEWFGNQLNNFVPGSRDTHGIQDVAEQWDDWKKYNDEQLQLISDTSATWTSISALVAELIANIKTGNIVGGVVSAGLGAVGGTAMKLLKINEASGLGKTIASFSLALESTQDAGKIVKNSIGAQKVFTAGGALTGSIVNISTQAVVDAALNDPVLFRRAIEGDGGEEAYNYLNEQFAWNAAGFGIGIGIGKVAMGAANTKVGRAINAKWAKGNAKLKTIGYNISDGLKAKIAHRSLEDVIAEADDIAKSAKKTEKGMYEIQSMRTEEQLATLKAETRAFADADIDVFSGLKINEDGLAEAEKYLTNMKALQNAIDMENRSLRLLVEGYDDVKINPEMAGINKKMYSDVMNINARQSEMINRTGKTFTRMNGSVFSQEAANYIGASIEVRYMESVIANPDYFSSSTVLSATKNIDSYREAIATYTKQFSPELKDALDTYIADGKKWYASMNQYRASKGLTNARDLEDLLENPMFNKGDYMRVQRLQDKRYVTRILEDGTTHTNLNIEFQHLEFSEMSDFMAPDSVQALYKINTANAERNLNVLKTRLSVKSAMKDILVSGEDTQLVKDIKASKTDFNKAADEYAKKFTSDSAVFDASSIKNDYAEVLARAKKESQLASDIKKTETGIEKTATKTYRINNADRIMAANTLAPTDVSGMLTNAGKSKTGSVLQDGLDEFADDAAGFQKWYNGLPKESRDTINRVRRDYNRYVGGMGPMSQAESLKLRDEIENIQRELKYLTSDETTRAWDDYVNWQKMAAMEQPNDALAELTKGEAKNAQDILERQMKHLGYDGDISVDGKTQFDNWLSEKRAAYTSDIDEKVDLLREYRGEPKVIEFPEDTAVKGLNRKNLSVPSSNKVATKTRRQLMAKELGVIDGTDSLVNDWFDSGDISAKKKIINKIEKNPKLRDATLSEMYDMSGSDLPYNEWLDTPIELRRVQSVDTLRNDDAFLSFSMADEWKGPLGTQGVEGDLLTLKVKPKDTYGSIFAGDANGEMEVLVPRDVYQKAASRPSKTAISNADWDINMREKAVANAEEKATQMKQKLAARNVSKAATDADYPGFRIDARDDGNQGLLKMLDETNPFATSEGTLRDYFRDYKGQEVAVLEMNPNDYNKLMVEDSYGRMLSDDMKKSASYYVDKFNNGERVAIPSISYDNTGKITGQEGRHRSYAAGQAGIEKMPVVVSYPTGNMPEELRKFKDVTDKFVDYGDPKEVLKKIDDTLNTRRANLASAVEARKVAEKTPTIDLKSGTEGTTINRISRDNLETLIGVDPNLEDTINLQVLKSDKDLLKSEQIAKMAEENKRVDDNFIRRNVLETQREELIKIIGERAADEFVDDIVDFADKTIDDYITSMKTDPRTQKFAKTIANVTGDSEDDVIRYLALTSLERNQSDINKQIKAAFGSADKEMAHIGTQVENAFDSMLTNYVDSIMMRMGDSELVSGELFDRIRKLTNDIEQVSAEAADDFSSVIATTDAQGRRMFMQIDPTVAKLYKTNIGHLQKPTSNWDNFNKLLSKTFRLGTTGVNLSSTMRQWFRDSGNAFGMGGAFRKIQSCADELIDDWGERIVQQLSDYDLGQLTRRAEETGEDIKKLAVERELRIGEVAAGQTTEVTLYRESLNKAKKLQDNVKGVRDKIEDIMNGKRENYLRNRVYANNLVQAMNNGKTLDEARIIAEFAMNNATTNFSRKLVHLQRMADSAPYLSAAINGTKSFWRMATLDPVGVMTRIMGGFVIPQMYLTVSSLADENNRKVYENLPEYTKSENIVFVQNGTAITVPIPQELAFIVDPFRQFVEGLYGANKNNFWELAANDILGAFPLDLSGFSAVDMDDLTSDPTIFDRIGRGSARVFSQVAPIPIKSAYMVATGIDPYSGKKLRDKSWVVWNDDTGSYETMDYNQSSFSKLIAGCFGKDTNTKIAEKVLSGIFGNTGMDVADTLVSTFQKFVLGDETAEPLAGLESQLGRVGNSLTGEDYSTLNSEWQRAIALLEEERDSIMASKEMQDIQTKLSQDIDDNTRQKLLSARKDLLADWQKRVASTTTRLAEQGGILDRYKLGAVVQLLNMNSVNGWTPSNKYLQKLANENYYAGRNEAYRTMSELGLEGVSDYSIFGYIKYKDGEPKIVYNSPTSIVNAGNLLLSAKDVDKANIDAIIDKEDLYKQREEMYKQTDAIYNKSKLSTADYNAIDAIKMAYNNKVLAALMPYLEKVSPEAITNNEQIMDTLENLIQVPSAYEKVNGKYVSSGNGKLNKQQGFVRSYIKTIINKENM